MSISASFLGFIVSIALLLSAIAPIVLLAFLFRDWHNDALW